MPLSRIGLSQNQKLTGNLTLSGTGTRIFGEEMQNANISLRPMFQNPNANLASAISILPNGTSTTAFLGVFGKSDASNSDYAFLLQQSGNTIIRSANTGSGIPGNIFFQTGPSTATRITIPSDAGGIQFPATQQASADPNTLDDYEEGNFTPFVRGSGTAGTFTYNATNTWGRYLKIGSWVYFQLSVQITAGSGSTGDLLVSGLPFTSRNFSNSYYSGSIGFFAFATTGWTQYDQSTLQVGGTTQAFLYYSASTGSAATASSALHGASYVYMSGSYLVD